MLRKLQFAFANAAQASSLRYDPEEICTLNFTD